jgi:hypothetical protein
MGTLISIDAWNRETQSRVTVRAGASLNASTLGAGGSPWEPVVARLPRFSMQLADDDLTGQLMVGTGEVAITAKDLIYAGDWRALDWIGSPIRVYSGDGQQLSDLKLEFVGRVTGGVTNADTGQAGLAMEANKTFVDVPLLRATYGGGGSADGDVELRGTNKPAGFGAPVNVRPVLINTVLQIYQADAYGNLTGFAGVYEDLGSFGASIGNYATYAALAAAPIKEGQWATCFAEGLFRLGATATGVITCDPVCGADLPGSMMLRWLQVHAGVPNAQIRVADFTALTAAVQAAVGAAPKVSYWTAEGDKVLDLMQRVCASCNAVPLIMLDGTIGVSRCIGGATLLTLNRQGGSPNVTAWAASDSPVPWWRLRMPAAKSYYVNSPSEIDYEDDVVDRGDYEAGETYRLGNVVRFQGDGARYIYINTLATAGNAPPAAGYWDLYQSAPDATTISYPGGGSVYDKMQSLQGQIDATVADNILSKGEKPQWVITYNGLVGDLNSLNDRYVALASPADITAARNDANAKMTSLGTYLNGLAPAWNNPATDTPIVANDFRAAWSNALISVAAFRAAITGRKGDKGADGTNGTNGVPGAPGIDGRTSYTHFAYANSSNGSIDFTTGAPGGRAFIGFYSDFVTADGNDPAAYEWSAYKGPPGFGLVATGAAQVAGNSLVNTAALGWGGAGGSSTEGWTSGAQTSFKLDVSTFAGLNSDPLANSSYVSIDYAIHSSGDGNTYIYESGNLIQSLGVNGDYSRTYQIAYNNAQITYYVNGVVVRQINAPSDMTLYFDAALSGVVGNKVRDITFTSSGRAGVNGLDGTNGLPGPPGTGGSATFLHIAYADSANGTVNFTTGAPGGRTYVGFVVDGTQADPTTPASYEWSLIKGADGLNGTNGSPGAPGANGLPTYVHIAYSDNANGTANFSLDNPTGRLYVGFYVDQTVPDSSNPALYSWSLIKGSDGSPGSPGAPGAPGNDGKPGITASVVPANVSLTLDFGGNVKAGQLPATAQIQIFSGAADVTASCTYQIESVSGCSATLNAQGLISLTTISALKGQVNWLANYLGALVRGALSYATASDGQPGQAISVQPASPPVGATYGDTSAAVTLAVGPGGTVTATHSLSIGVAQTQREIGTRILYRTTPGSGAWSVYASGAATAQAGEDGSAYASATIAAPGGQVVWEFMTQGYRSGTGGALNNPRATFVWRA